jgi:hypothetical protein
MLTPFNRYTTRTGKTKAVATIRTHQHVASRQLHVSVTVGAKVYWINRLHHSESRAYQAALMLAATI